MRVDLSVDRCSCAIPVRKAGSGLCHHCLGNLPPMPVSVGGARGNGWGMSELEKDARYFADLFGMEQEY